MRKKRISLEHPIVLIVWNDAESIDDWTEGHLLDCGVTEVHSVGFLLSEDPEAVTLALNHDTKNKSYSCVMKIPIGMILEQRIIKK